MGHTSIGPVIPSIEAVDKASAAALAAVGEGKVTKHVWELGSGPISDLDVLWVQGSIEADNIFDPLQV